MVHPNELHEGDFEELLDFIRSNLPDRFSKENRVEDNNHVFTSEDGSEAIGILFLTFDDVEIDQENYVEIDLYSYSSIDDSLICHTEEELLAELPDE